MDCVNVLMVEDNPGDVVLVKEAAVKAGLSYTVNVVRDGVEATEYLQQAGRHAGVSRPDLIILDLKLPRKNGRELLGEIRLDSVLSRIPLVLLSSSQSELEAARSCDLPAESYMVKPGTFAGYVSLVESIEEFRRKAESHGGTRP